MLDPRSCGRLEGFLDMQATAGFLRPGHEYRSIILRTVALPAAGNVVQVGVPC